VPDLVQARIGALGDRAAEAVDIEPAERAKGQHFDRDDYERDATDQTEADFFIMLLRSAQGA